MFRFSIRDLLWMAVVVGLACVLLIQNRQLAALMSEQRLLRSRLASAKYNAKELADLRRCAIRESQQMVAITPFLKRLYAT